jgi:outer membrane protein assembly factor BamA
VPIINFNTDEGFGYGALVMLVDRADGSYSPYRASLFAQFFQTTRNIASHKLTLDLPRFLQSEWRVGLTLNYYRSRFTPYYGLGNTSEYIEAYSSCEDREALATNPDVCPGNERFRGLRYYTFDVRGLPRIILNVRRELSEPFKLFLGYRFRGNRLWTRYSAEDLGQSGQSRLAEDLAAGRFAPTEGSQGTVMRSERTSEVTAGLQYDTRDQEASPTSGMFHEVAVRGAAGPIGSQLDYWGATLHARAWTPVVPGYERLVAAGRVHFDVLGGEVPVTLLPDFGGLEGGDGIGGVFSARGILKRRFIGPVKLLLNAELRWTPLSLHPGGQDFDFSLVGFLDSGRVWSNLRFSEGGGLTTSAGGGLHIAWNREFVIRADYGLGLTEPTTGFYLEFGQMF